MIVAEREGRRPATGDGFADAVTFSWGDLGAGVFGLARTGLTADPEPAATTLVVLFVAGRSVVVRAHADPVAADAGWSSLEAGGLRTSLVEPLASWRAAFAGDAGGFDLRFEASSPPLELDADAPAARAGGMEGYEQLCRVSGSVETDGAARHELDCPGQRGHTWGTVDWGAMESVRTVSAWWGEDLGLTLSSVRPKGANGHGEEAVTAHLFDAASELPDEPLDEARVSTTYDAEGRQRRAGLELWETEETEIPRRATGQVVAGTSLDLGELRLECAFYRWSLEEREGVGRYDILRRA